MDDFRLKATSAAMAALNGDSRASSPSPTASPSVVLPSRPRYDRVMSSPSAVPSLSSRSLSMTSDASSGPRGYMKPLGTSFSNSARNRDSVMSLGSIAHMQYYFSKTGQLDGKGGQHARPDQHDKRTTSLNINDRVSASYDDVFGPETDDDGSVTFDMSELRSDLQAMLPPTASTYKAKPLPVHILPATAELREVLRVCLTDAQALLQQKGLKSEQEGDNRKPIDSPTVSQQPMDTMTFDVLSRAIRAAKDYYVGHHDIARLYAIRSERDIRRDLYHALEHLQGLVNRGSDGELKEAEVLGLLEWSQCLSDLLDSEERYEARERTLRRQYSWLHGDWEGRERERERSFLQSFRSEQFSDWTEPINGEQCEFLRSLQSGVVLLQTHNELVDRSGRRFGTVSNLHTDTAKHYRAAENLRYWTKAAELRWEVKLDLDVLDLVYEKTPTVWRDFDRALLRWCGAVRREITSAWLESPTMHPLPDRPPILADEGPALPPKD